MSPAPVVLREPVYIWDNQKRIAERFQQNLDAGLEIGRTFGNTVQVSAEWRAQDTRWASAPAPAADLISPGPRRPACSTSTSTRPPQQPFRPAATAWPRPPAPSTTPSAAAMRPMAPVLLQPHFSFSQNNIFGISAEVNSYLRANVAQPFRFTLGGPMRLSASSFDEYRGTDTYLARAGYMRRIAALPTGLGQGLYGLLGYEAGEVWSPEHPRHPPPGRDRRTGGQHAASA